MSKFHNIILVLAASFLSGSSFIRTTELVFNKDVDKENKKGEKEEIKKRREGSSIDHTHPTINELTYNYDHSSHNNIVFIT